MSGDETWARAPGRHEGEGGLPVESLLDQILQLPERRDGDLQAR